LTDIKTGQVNLTGFKMGQMKLTHFKISHAKYGIKSGQPVLKWVNQFSKWAAGF